MNSLALITALALLAGTALAKEATTNIKVPKMDCDSCAVVVRRALAKASGVKTATINIERRVVIVVYDDAVTTIPALRKTIEGTGFVVETSQETIKK